MKGKASDICPKCKHCEGLDMFVKMYSCKHYNNYPDAAIGVDSEIECDNFEEETNMNKVEGKVSDFCPKCKNCKGMTRESNGVHDWLTEVECEDPYDGMTKTLNTDSDICCSMFEPKSDRSCEKCERFDGTYCHGSNGTITISYKALFGEPVNCPSYEEKNEKEQFNLNTSREQLESKILDLFEEKNRLNSIINGLKLRNNNQVTMIEGLKLQYNDLSEKLERVESHDKALTKHFQNDEALINNIQKVIFPQEEGSDYTYNYDEILDKIKFLKAYSDENSQLYEELQGWKENCHKAEADVTILNSKVEVLDKRNTNQCVMIGERDKEIENLKKMVERRDRWVKEFRSDVYTLQNEVLRIRDIAQKAYDDTNRD